MTYPKPPEFVAQRDRVPVVGVATGKIKATNRTFVDHWVFDITVNNGKLKNVRECVDTQALTRASEMDTNKLLSYLLSANWQRIWRNEFMSTPPSFWEIMKCRRSLRQPGPLT